MSPTLSIALDALNLVVLGTTIFYCLRVSRQLNQVRADRQVFENLIQGLNLSSARAEAAIRAFRETASDGGESLQDKINKGHAMADELEIMIQAGDSLADRLQMLAEKGRKSVGETAETKAADARPAAEPQPRENQTGVPREGQTGVPRTRAEKELLEAIRAKQKS